MWFNTTNNRNVLHFHARPTRRRLALRVFSLSLFYAFDQTRPRKRDGESILNDRPLRYVAASRPRFAHEPGSFCMRFPFFGFIALKMRRRRRHANSDLCLAVFFAQLCGRFQFALVFRECLRWWLMLPPLVTARFAINRFNQWYCIDLCMTE